MRLLKAENHVRMPWKNGGGETVEVAVHPPGTGLRGFDWRVSMAVVAADGPFSLFPGIDRTLAVLDGEGVALSVEGQGSHHLTPATAPLAFPGDVPVVARLVAGPITDLNVMTRRLACQQRVTRLSGPPFAARGRWIVLVAVSPSAVVVDGRTISLSRRDALLSEGGITVAGCGDGPVDLFAVEIDPVAPS
jgi:environmental stress-induced protein Ves